MKAEFETPIIEIVYLDQSIKLNDPSNFYD